MAYGRACTAGCYALGFTSRDVVIWSRHFVIQAGCAAKECGRRRDATGSSGMRSRLLLSAPPRVGCPGCPLWVISGHSVPYHANGCFRPDSRHSETTFEKSQAERPLSSIAVIQVARIEWISMAAFGCDFKRSTQHFVGKPLSRKNAFESEE